MTKIPHRLSTEQCNDYRNNGYLVIRELFSENDIADVSSALNELEDQAKHMIEDTYKGVSFFNLHKACDPFDPAIDTYAPAHGILRRVTYPYAVNETLDTYRTQTSIIGVMHALLGPDINQLVNQVNFNPPGLGLGWGWHQDYRFRRPGLVDPKNNYVQCLIAIDPCNERTGGLRLIPQSDRRGGLELDKDPSAAAKLLHDTPYVTPELAPGDGVIFNPFIIHGSTPNRSDAKRRVFINGYASAHYCDYGRTVLRGGALKRGHEAMEYEDDPARLAKASKY